MLELSSVDSDVAKGDPAEDQVIGITSFGGKGGCGHSDLPGVFTRLSSYKDWINEKMGLLDAQSALPEQQV